MQEEERHAINKKINKTVRDTKQTKSRVNITNYKNVTYVQRCKKHNIHSNKTKTHTSIQNTNH